MNIEHTKQSYMLKDFMPLIVIASIIIGFTGAHQLYYGWNLFEAMRIMMASFFLMFGFFKVINLKGFAEAYSIYDLLASRIYWYGYVYPFLEITLGISYLLNWNPLITNSCTLVLMLFSAASVFNELKKGKHITCACLGTIFKIPMTYVTLFEDLVMAGMALWMLMYQ